MRKSSLISLFLSLIVSNDCCGLSKQDIIQITNLYKVSFALLNSDNNTYDTPQSLGNNTPPGFCLKYFNDEDLLIIAYNTPTSGVRAPGKLIIEPNEGNLPNLMSLIVPNEIKDNVSVQQANNATTGAVAYTLEIIISSEVSEGKIKIRFLSTVDITPVGAAADNTYILSSEYFNKVDATLTANGYQLNTVKSNCNVYKWFKKALCFLDSVFCHLKLPENALIGLVEIYRSEITRKNEAHCAKLYEHCIVEDKCSKSESSDCESNLFEPKVCDKKVIINDVKCCAITPEAIYKSASICALFNVCYDNSNLNRCYNSFMESVLSLKVALNMKVVVSMLDKFLSSCGYKHGNIDDCLKIRKELDLDLYTEVSISEIYGDNLHEDDCGVLEEWCSVPDSYVSSYDQVEVKNKTSISVGKSKKAKTSKKSKDSDKSDSESSDSSEEESEGFGGKKIVIAVGIVVVVAVCAYAVSYML